MEWKKAIEIEKNKNTFQIPENWLYLHYYESLTILFRIENVLRVFVYTILKKEFKEKWAEISIASDDSAEGTISSIAKKRLNQSQNFGYLGYFITCPIMHLTSGELIRLITSESYWKFFKKYFLGNKSIMESKLLEIGNVRNSLAHFRPIKEDDIEVVRQNAKHVLVSVENCINDMLNCNDIVPTNTSDEWYKELRTLGTENCTLNFHQSNSTEWVKITINYNCPVISHNSTISNTYLSYKTLTIESSAILRKYTALANYLIFMSEFVTSYLPMPENLIPNFSKQISIVFSRETLSSKFKEVKSQIEELFLNISKETELIKLDNLAQGELVKSVDCTASYNTNQDVRRWNIRNKNLSCKVKENDPPEYWGEFYNLGNGFVTNTNIFPWMPTEVSLVTFPF